MKPTVAGLEKAIVETPEHDVVKAVEADVVAMSDEEIAPIEGEPYWLLVDHYAQFGLKIVEHPGIMIAREEMDLYASLDQFGNLGLETDEAPWDNSLILKPIVENVAEDIKRRGVGFY